MAGAALPDADGQELGGSAGEAEATELLVRPELGGSAVEADATELLVPPSVPPWSGTDGRAVSSELGRGPWE